MNNGSCYVQLAGCGVRETSHAWFSSVHPVSKLPEKRIISGNDHWHCPTLLMAISQYLTSHHLCQSYKQRVMCGARTVSSVCCTFYHRTQQWARNCDLNAWQACEMSCWTGCWVMWFYEACRDQPASHRWWCHLNFSLCFPLSFILDSYHTALVTHCVVCEQHCRDMWARS